MMAGFRDLFAWTLRWLSAAPVVPPRTYVVVRMHSNVDGAVEAQSRIDGAAKAQSHVNGAVETQSEPC